MSTPSHVLAADLGSTNFKVALFDAGGARISEGSRPLPYIVRTNTRAELDPAAVTECFMGCVQDALRSAGLPASAIRRVSFTSQAQTCCVCDESGKPLGPFISWTDIRAEEEAAFLRTVLGGEYHAQAGWPRISPSHSVSMALWWKKRHGLRPGDRIVLLPSFVAMQLGAPHVSDSNIAPMSGFYSIPESGWWDRMLEAAGISADRLGGVVDLGQPVSTQADRRPAEFSPALEIVFAGNDHTAGAWGCGCSKRRPVLTLGTAGVLYRLAGDDLGPFSERGLWGPYPGGGYYELVVIGHACSAMDWADQFLFGAVDSPRFAEHASRAKVTLDSPFFYPERWGSAEAWKGEGTVEEKAYAAMEGILYAILNLVPSGFLETSEEMVVLGGGSRLGFWLQMASDIFRCPLRPGTSDGLSGAARLAGCPVPDTAPSPESIRTPRAERLDFHRRRFEGWKANAAR